jgi:hypothetical protein
LDAGDFLVPSQFFARSPELISGVDDASAPAVASIRPSARNDTPMTWCVWASSRRRVYRWRLL